MTGGERKDKFNNFLEITERKKEEKSKKGVFAVNDSIMETFTCCIIIASREAEKVINSMSTFIIDCFKSSVNPISNLRTPPRPLIPPSIRFHAFKTQTSCVYPHFSSHVLGRNWNIISANKQLFPSPFSLSFSPESYNDIMSRHSVTTRSRYFYSANATNVYTAAAGWKNNKTETEAYHKNR